MDKEVDFNFERYVGNLKKKLQALEADLETILHQKEVQQAQIKELETRKANSLAENDKLSISLQQLKAKKLEFTLKNQQLTKEFKQKNIEYIRLVDEANEKAQSLQNSINASEEEYKALQVEKQQVLHSNDDLIKKKEQVQLTFSHKQQLLDKKIKENQEIEDIDNKRREALAKTFNELQS